MTKKVIFYILSFFIFLSIFYIVFFVYFFFNLEKEFKYNFQNLNNLNFYKKYLGKVNHLRFEPIKKNNINKEYQLFNKITNSENKKTILFQGDSWFEQINYPAIVHESGYVNVIKNPKRDQLISLLNIERWASQNNFGAINAGIASYSPSLMNIQYNILEDDFNIKPEILVIYIDQTDIGDEFCRYKNLREIDPKGNLSKVGFENYPIHKGPFNLHEILVFSEIDLTNKSKIIKNQKYINYKFKKSLNRIKKMYQKKIKKNYPFRKCGWRHMESYLISPDNKAINHFKYVLQEYFKSVTEKKYLKKIFVVTHPHKLHLSPVKYNVDVSDIVKTVVLNYPKIEHINFSELVKENPNLYKNINEVWQKDQIHLNITAHGLFLEEILNRISAN